MFELLTLSSGVQSLRAIHNQETFHPGMGPRREANLLHVDQQRLVERCALTDPFVIWDIGLGACANATAVLSAMQTATPLGRVELHSFEKTLEPVTFSMEHAHALEYPVEYLDLIAELVAKRVVHEHPKLPLRINPGLKSGVLECRDGVCTPTLGPEGTHPALKGEVSLSSMSWTLHLGDFADAVQSPHLPSPHAILYDPYSPKSNPEMWNLDHFTHLFSRLDPQRPCLWTNYSRSTAVRVALLLAGFYVGIGVELGQKAESTVASNDLNLLLRPLGLNWLKRVQLSRNSAPQRDSTVLTPGPICAEDFERLKNCAQFKLLTSGV